MGACRTIALGTVLFVGFVSPAVAQQKDLTYNAITPCVVADTRVAIGPFSGGETRNFKVIGSSSSFPQQGGSPTGCGVPGFVNGVARVQAVALNIVAIAATGPGHLVVWASDAAPLESFLNFTTGQTVANTGPVAVAQAAGVGDFKITSAFSGTHLKVTVVGYYTRFGETILVAPGATPAASGTALLSALASIADNSATKPYLIKLEPGVYDVGSTMVVMKPYVDLEGSGQRTTTIQGLGNNDGTNETAVISGASNAELRNLQVKSLGAGFGGSIGILVWDADTRLSDVTVTSSGAAGNWGVRALGLTGGAVLEHVTFDVQGGINAYGIVSRVSANVTVRNSRITVSNSSNSYGLYFVDGFPEVLSGLQVDVSGAVSATGVFVDPQSFPGVFRLDESRVIATGAAANYGFNIPSGGGSVAVLRSSITGFGGSASYGLSGFGPVRIDHSEITGETSTVNVFGDVRIGATRLSGGSMTAGLCAGVYDENYTFFASTCP